MSEHDAVVQLFRTAVDALDREDWTAAADLCDPVSLDAFRRDVLESFGRRALLPEDITEDDFMRRSPEMPRPVAEYHTTRMREIVSPERRLRDQFPGVRSVEELRSLSPRDLFACFLDGRSARRVHTGGEAYFVSRLAARLNGERRDGHRHIVIGVLPDGDRMAHLIYRIKLDARQRREGDEWEPEGDREPDLPADCWEMGEREPWQDDVPPWTGEESDEPDVHDFELVPDEEQRLTLELIEYGNPQSVLCRRQPDGRWALIADDDFLGIGGVIAGIVQYEVEREARSDEEGDEEE